MPRDLQPNFTGGEIAPSLHSRTDLDRYHISLAKCSNWIIHAQGGVSTRGGTKFVQRAPVGNKVRLIPFQFNVDQAYMLVLGDQKMNIVRDGGLILNDALNIVAVGNGNPSTIAVNSNNLSDGQLVLIEGTGLSSLDNKFFAVSNVSGSTFDINADGSGWTSGGTIRSAVEIATGFDEDILYDIRFTQSADVLTLTHPSFFTREVRRLADNDWQIAGKSYGSSATTPDVPSVTQVGTASGGPNKTYRYRVSTVDENDSESPPSSLISSGSINSLTSSYGNKITWPAVSGAAYYNVYKENSLNSNVFGFIGEADASGSPEFTDFNFGPDMSYTPTIAENPYSTSGNYPSCVAYHQQRLVLASTDNNPQEIRLSKTGDFDNMNVSRPTRADDSISFSISSRQVNRIIHLLSLDVLMAFTSEAPWIIKGNGSEVMTPSSISAKRQGGYGSSNLTPIVIGESVMYIQSRGSKVRDLSYNFNDDKYISADLSLMAEHLFYGYTITDWCYSAEPYGMIWAVRSDGVMLSLTYLKDQQVWGWAQHHTDGEFESVASIPEDSEDIVYAVVKRTINGEDVRYIERMNERRFTDIEDAFFVDSGLTYNGAPTSTLSGLDHLEGKTLVALADGNVIENILVIDGAVTLPTAASKISIGLSYTCDLETLDIDFQGQQSVQSYKKSVSGITMKVEKTRGLSVSKDGEKFYEVKERSASDDYGRIPLKTGQQDLDLSSGWTDGGKIRVRQSYPLPATVLAIIPDINVG